MQIVKAKDQVDEHPVEKIPDFILLKLARQEVGKMTSYAQELEDENKALKIRIKYLEGLSLEEKKEIRLDKRFEDVKAERHKLFERIKKLKKDNEALIYAKLDNCRNCVIRQKSSINQ